MVGQNGAGMPRARSPQQRVAGTTSARSPQQRVADEKSRRAKQTHLRLERKGIRSTAPHLQGFPSLQVLYLFDNHITALDGLQLVPLLTHLYVQNNQLATIDLSPLLKLQKLYLDGNCFSSLESLDSLSQPETLVELQASNQRLDGQPLLLAPDALRNLSSLQAISLAGNGLSDVAALVVLPSLTKLDLAHNRISDFESVAPVLENAPGVAELNLVGNPIAASRQAMDLAVMTARSLVIINGRTLLPTERACLLKIHGWPKRNSNAGVFPGATPQFPEPPTSW